MVIAQNPRDPRAARTLERLRGGMSTLMETKTLDHITVAELCRVSGVHRTTFYKHFDSVASFATESFAELLDELAIVEPRGETGELVDAYLSATVATLEHIADQRTLYRRLFDPRGDLVFQRAVADAMAARAALAIQALQERGIETGTDDETAAAMIGGAVAAACAVWAAQDDDDVLRRAHAIAHLMPPWWPRPGTDPQA